MLRLKKILGYEPESVISQPIFNFIHPDDVAAARRDWRKLASQTLGSTTSFEHRYLHKNGSWRTLQSLGQKLT